MEQVGQLVCLRDWQLVAHGDAAFESSYSRSDHGENPWSWNVLIQSFLEFGTGQFLHEPQSGKWRNWKFSMNHERYIAIPMQVRIFPHEWLRRSSEKQFPHEWRSHEWGNYFLLRLLSHEWGKIMTRMGIAMYLEWWIGNFSCYKFQKWLDPHSY